MSDDGIIKVHDENGQEKKYSLIATIEYNNKNFVLYTDYQTDESSNIKIYSSLYNPNEENSKLEKITEPEEIEFIKNYVQGLEEDLKSGMKF